MSVDDKVTRWVRASQDGLARTRRRFPPLDRLVRAGIRYREADGRRLAAAATYYGFFATFAMALVGFATLGYVLDEPVVERFLAENLPQLDAGAVREAGGTVGIIAFVGLPVIGWLWVDALRSSIRAIWRVEEYPGRMVVRVLIEVFLLLELGMLFGVSLAVALGTTAGLDWAVAALIGPDVAVARWLHAGAAFILGLAVNTLLAVNVLTALPRLRVPARQVLGPALLVAVGLELLKTGGRLFVERTDANPAFQVAAGTAGLLVFLFLLHQLVLFAAALTATDPRRDWDPPSREDRAVDLPTN